MWGMAISAGMSMVGSLMGNAKKRKQAAAQAYNDEYARVSNQYAVMEQIGDIQRNMAAIQQDKVLSDVTIGMKQDQAEAQMKVSAAVAGAKGSSVENSIQQSEFNEQQALSGNKRQTEQAMESELANMGTASKALYSIGDAKDPSSYDTGQSMGEMLIGAGSSALSAMTSEDMDSFDNLFKNTGGYKLSGAKKPSKNPLSSLWSS